MEHNDVYKQTFSNAKRNAAISVALVGALLVGGVKVGSYFNKKNDKTPIDATPQTTMIDPATSELVLTEDFDINNDEQVNKRAQAIYELSEKEYSVEDIKNTIYLFNEKYDKVVYPKTAKTDDEKFEYLQQLALLLGKTLDDYLKEYVQVYQKSNKNITIDQLNVKDVPCAYMWMAKDSDAKKLAINIAKVYYEQRDNIRNDNKAAMTVTANDYYNLFVEAKKLKLSAGDKVLVFKQFNSINPIFTMFLSKECAEDLDKSLGLTIPATNKIFMSAAEDLDLSEKLEEGLEKGTFGKEITKTKEKYVSSDKAVAEKIIDTNDSDKTKVVIEGGKEVGTQQVVIQDEVTTKVETSEFVVDIPNEGTTCVTEKGGEVVDTITPTTTKPSNSTTTKPSTTKPSDEPTTTKPSTTKPSSETTMTTTTTSYVDDEDIPVMDEEEFFGWATDEDADDYRSKASNKSVEALGYSMLAGGSLGAVLSKKKRK